MKRRRSMRVCERTRRTVFSKILHSNPKITNKYVSIPFVNQSIIIGVAMCCGRISTESQRRIQRIQSWVKKGSFCWMVLEHFPPTISIPPNVTKTILHDLLLSREKYDDRLCKHKKGVANNAHHSEKQHTFNRHASFYMMFFAFLLVHPVNDYGTCGPWGGTAKQASIQYASSSMSGDGGDGTRKIWWHDI